MLMTQQKLGKDTKSALVTLYDAYNEGLAPILHLAFAEVRNFYDVLYEATDNYPELHDVGEELDVPLDQLLTHIRLLEQVFDKNVRPICPAKFARKTDKEGSEIQLPDVLVNLLENVGSLLRSYAASELDGDIDEDGDEKLKEITTELNILCVLFLSLLSNKKRP